MRTEAEETGMMMTGNIGADDSWQQCVHTLFWHLCQFRCISQCRMYVSGRSVLPQALAVALADSQSDFRGTLQQTLCLPVSDYMLLHIPPSNW